METSVTVTAVVLGEVSSGVIATTTEIVQDPSFWDAVINFFKALF